jgi:hypothetical protein
MFSLQLFEHAFDQIAVAGVQGHKANPQARVEQIRS